MFVLEFTGKFPLFVRTSQRLKKPAVGMLSSVISGIEILQLNQHQRIFVNGPFKLEGNSCYAPFRLLTIVEMMTCRRLQLNSTFHLIECVCVDNQLGKIPRPALFSPMSPDHLSNDHRPNTQSTEWFCANWIGCQMFLHTNYPPLHAQGMSTLLLRLQSHSILHSWRTL